jgi:hypothetical protein
MAPATITTTPAKPAPRTPPELNLGAPAKNTGWSPLPPDPEPLPEPPAEPPPETGAGLLPLPEPPLPPPKLFPPNAGPPAHGAPLKLRSTASDVGVAWGAASGTGAGSASASASRFQ